MEGSKSHFCNEPGMLKSDVGNMLKKGIDSLFAAAAKADDICAFSEVIQDGPQPSLSSTL